MVLQCHNCGWIGDEGSLEAGWPADVEFDPEELDGSEIDYYRDTPSCCPDCGGSDVHEFE